jgi:hypothetical protein
MKLNAFLLAALLSLVTGCGSSTDDPHARTENTQDPPAGPTTGWQTLVTGDWSLPAGGEEWVCVRKTLKEDLFVGGFESISPTGTHHAVLTFGVPDAPDGQSPCTGTTVFRVSAYGGGRGVVPLMFPQGIARKIPKGSQLLLNLHLFNSYGEALEGTSGVRAFTIPESEVVELTEHVATGTQILQIPAREKTVHTGYCTMTSDVTLIAVAPHMHRLGTHQRVFAETAAGEITLLDAPFDLDSQSYRPLESVKLARGERVRVECTHENTTDESIGYGDSALDEMCTAAVYRYPADNTLFFCHDR